MATGLLREGLGFEGVAITDDLGAGAVRAGYSAPKAAVSALAAGADMVRIDAPEDQRGVREAIVAAVETARSRSRVCNRPPPAWSSSSAPAGSLPCDRDHSRQCIGAIYLTDTWT